MLDALVVYAKLKFVCVVCLCYNDDILCVAGERECVCVCVSIQFTR